VSTERDERAEKTERNRPNDSDTPPEEQPVMAPEAESQSAGDQPPPAEPADGEAVTVGQLEDRLLRIAAEFENYKKRRQRETEDLLRYGYESLARDLLPVLDSFERAIQSSEQTREYDPFHDGIVMILAQFREVMRRHGVERIEPVGEAFDPHTHEAVGVIPDSALEPGHIAEVLEPGYLMHERVIRAPRVLVTQEPDEETSGAGEQDETTAGESTL